MNLEEHARILRWLMVMLTCFMVALVTVMLGAITGIEWLATTGVVIMWIGAGALVVGTWPNTKRAFRQYKDNPPDF